ncbi:MAG TPA: Uma2 family endonuclease [Ktedonosporobacter sp.]|jgi:Uma2 family endonuclease|nr:Uma2 family endonuclease [Ktedonosporobacter sp.]
MALPQYPTIDPEDYLTLDRNSKNARYEYLDGELRMLAGGSTYHSAIIANLTGIFNRALEDSSYWVFNSDIRLQLSESRYVYPDITISCHQSDQELDDMIRYPCIVIEVLSPGTEAIDRGKKFIYYQECSSIQEYIMVDSQSIRVEVYHREHDGWKLHTFGPGSIVTIETLNIQFPIDAIYRHMKLSETRNKNSRG